MIVADPIVPAIPGDSVSKIDSNLQTGQEPIDKFYVKEYTAPTNNQTDPMETFFSGDIKLGGFGGPEVRYTRIQGEDAMLVGGKGGLLLNHSFVIGGAGYGIVTSHKVDGYDWSGIEPFKARDSVACLEGGWGGLYMEYINHPHKRIHLAASALIGAGGLVYTNPRDWDDDKKHEIYESSAFFVFEPGIWIELNVFKFMRIDFGAAYRVVAGLDLPNTENSDLSGPSLNMAVKFGSF